MKENNGQAARRKLLRKIGIVLFIFVCFMGALVLVDTALEERNAGDHRRKRQSLVSKLRSRTKSKMHSKKVVKVDPGLVKSEEFQRILSAELTLIDVQVLDASKLRNAGTDDYDGVTGVFCQLSWAAHKEDPSTVPMFRDILAASDQCRHNLVKVPLRQISQVARDMDEANRRRPTDPQVPKPLNFTGIVFHESRCGSTLVANALIGMDPLRHRVFSESPPPVSAMRICGDDYEKCSVDKAAAVLKDALYLMGRTNDPNEERVFFKIQSIGTRHIGVFRMAFPTTPWLFVYRDPVEVIMSHLALGTRRANCLRSLQNPPNILRQLVKRHGYAGGPSQLSAEDFCAAHLATITETALTNLQESEYGIAVNYDSLPQVLYQKVLPLILGVATGPTEIERIVKVAGQYSKGRGTRKKDWKDDSEKKQEAASKEIRNAATQFMLESYTALQSLAESAVQEA